MQASSTAFASAPCSPLRGVVRVGVMPGAVEMGKDAVPYGEPTYWDERYQTSREKLGPEKYYFDWYCTFEDIWPVLQTYCGKEMVESTHQVLVIGCGNSRLPELMWAAGFRSITSSITPP